jgi:hypothetical protein
MLGGAAGPRLLSDTESLGERIRRSADDLDIRALSTIFSFRRKCLAMEAIAAEDACGAIQAPHADCNTTTRLS